MIGVISADFSLVTVRRSVVESRAVLTAPRAD
jgi:hypothetical protein